MGGGGFRGCGWSGEGSGKWERGELNEVMMVNRELERNGFVVSHLFL